MSHDDDAPNSTPPPATTGGRPRRLSGERLRLRARREGESAPTLREVARWLGYMGLRNGPHATWARPLGGNELSERLERARARLHPSWAPTSHSARRVRAVGADNDTQDDDQDDETRTG